MSAAEGKQLGLVWMRRIFLQMLAVRINAHLDLVSTADYFTPIAKLEQVVNEELDETASPLNLWSRLAPHLKWHRRWVLWQKRVKRSIWREYDDAEEPHLFKAEINTMVTFICVMEEAWDELAAAVAAEAHAETQAETSRHSVAAWGRARSMLQTPVMTLREELDAQLHNAHETLQFVPPAQLQAATTMKLAQAILSNRMKILHEMDASGLWYEGEQLPEHHHIEHQLGHATDLRVIPKPRDLRMRGETPAILGGGAEI